MSEFQHYTPTFHSPYHYFLCTTQVIPDFMSSIIVKYVHLIQISVFINHNKNSSHSSQLSSTFHIYLSSQIIFVLGLLFNFRANFAIDMSWSNRRHIPQRLKVVLVGCRSMLVMVVDRVIMEVGNLWRWVTVQRVDEQKVMYWSFFVFGE